MSKNEVHVSNRELSGTAEKNFFLRSALAVILVSLLLAVQPLSAQDKDQKSSGKSIGFVLSDEATAHDVGLPIYPGARLHKDENNDTPALQMGLWGKSSGFKLAVLKLESSDAPEKIVAFYRKALAKYGAVMDCSKVSASKNDSDQDDSDVIDCKSDHPEPASVTLKSGTKRKQHVVGIQPNSKGTLFQLVYVETPKSD